MLCLSGEQVPRKLLNYVDTKSVSTNGTISPSSLIRGSRNYLVSKLWSRNGINVAEIGQDSKEDHPQTVFGNNGELVMCFDDRIEVYDWRLRGDGNGNGNGNTSSPQQPSDTPPSSSSTGSTDFGIPQVAKFSDLPNCHKILKALPVSCFPNNNCYQLLAFVETKEERTLQLWFLDSRTQPIVVDLPVTHTNYSVSLNNPDGVCVLADNLSGLLHVFSGKFICPTRTYKSKVVNGRCVFDFCQDWLVFEQKGTASAVSSPEIPLSSVLISHRISLLNKILHNLSASTIDSFCMFAEISQFKLKQMFDGKNLPPAGTNLKNYRDIVVKLYNTINSNSDYLIMIDIKQFKPMFRFVPPDGCSKVSISPYDMQLVTASKRGDDLCLWDFTCYHKGLTLLDKFERGKTFSIIDQVCWLPNDRSIAVLSRQNGSVHYFVNESLTKSYEYETDDRKSSWCLSSLGASQIAVSPENYSVLLALKGNSLVAIDLKNRLNTWVFGVVGQKEDRSGPAAKGFFDYCFGKAIQGTEGVDPMDQVEIETCNPFPALYNSRRVLFSRVKGEISEDLFRFGDCLCIESEEVRIAGGREKEFVGKVNGDEGGILGELTGEAGQGE